jgi:hypothetical protein
MCLHEVRLRTRSQRATTHEPGGTWVVLRNEPMKPLYEGIQDSRAFVVQVSVHMNNLGQRERIASSSLAWETQLRK